MLVIGLGPLGMPRNPPGQVTDSKLIEPSEFSFTLKSPLRSGSPCGDREGDEPVKSVVGEKGHL